MQDGYAVVASDGPGEYPIITYSRAGNDGLGVLVTPGTVAYVTTGGKEFMLTYHSCSSKSMLQDCIKSITVQS